MQYLDAADCRLNMGQKKTIICVYYGAAAGLVTSQHLNADMSALQRPPRAKDAPWPVDDAADPGL